MSDDFDLDPRLAADTRFVADLALSRVLLMDDARFPWLILVPRRAGLGEMAELNAGEQADLLAEIQRATAALRACATFDKLNIGALGNVVRQLHVHLVGRRAEDAAWPGPVWGCGRAEPYCGEVGVELIRQLAQALLS